MRHEASDSARTSSLKGYAWLSIAAAIATIGLKGGAWLITDSVGLLSDAAESIVNLIAAIVALYALTVAERPADDEHAYCWASATKASSATAPASRARHPFESRVSK